MKNLIVVLIILVFSTALVSAEQSEPKRDPSESEGPAFDSIPEKKISTNPASRRIETPDETSSKGYSLSENTLPENAEGESTSSMWGFYSPEDEKGSKEKQ